MTLALFMILYMVGVSELQGSTYSPEVEQSVTATTTQPDAEVQQEPEQSVAEDTATSSAPAPSSVELEELNIHIPPGKEGIVGEILEVFPDAPIMVVVAKCESGFYPQADRENRNVDVGLFQINQVHLDRLNDLGLDRRNLQDNLTYARMLYDEQGLGPWYMSEHCWSNYL